jgi:ubiquinone/menaquinone biosynthesis C-methylase UbiE
MEKYWDRYYTKSTNEEPSNFVKYVVEKGYIKNKDTVIDIACGNGRDTKYLEDKCHAIGIDNSISAINKAKSICKKSILKNIKAEELKYSNIDVVYMRWFLHTVKKDIATKCLKNAYKGLKKYGYLLIETRYGKNNILNFNPFHYRRMINEDIIKELLDLGFGVIDYSVGNFSKIGNNNPKLIRIFCQKI